MDDWERYFVHEGGTAGPADRRRTLGVFIITASALATLALILWLISREFGGV